MIRIWGYERSSNVQKVLWAADELGVAWEMEPIGGPHGGLKEPRYLALNPNGQIPTLEDGDFVLWESNAILAYLVDRYGPGGLLPDTPQGRARARAWMDWQLAALNAPSGRVMRLTIRTPAAERDADAVAEAAAELAAMWRRFEDGFGDGPFVAGDFSIGDIPVGVHAARWFRYPIERPALPRLEAWYERLCARPAYRTHVAAALMPGERAE